MNGKGDELVVQQETDAIIADDDIVAIAEVAGKRVEAIKKIISMALQVTSEKDWVNQNGRPYLQGEGAEAVANLFGVSWTFVEKPQKVNEGEGHFRYECTLKLMFRNRNIEVIGARSTKDTFFSTRYRYNKDTREKEAYQLPPTEIDEADVMKASITNAIGNGITRILGIRNATWDMLKEAGLNVERIRDERGVSYKQTEDSAEVKDKKEEIRNMLLVINGNDGEKAKQMLQELTLWKGKSKSNVKDLTEAQVPVIYGKVKKQYEEWQKQNPEKAQVKQAPEEPPKPPTEQPPTVQTFEIRLHSSKTLEELDEVLTGAVKAKIKGEDYTNLIRLRDKCAVALKEQSKQEKLV